MQEKAAIVVRPEEPRDFAAVREIHRLSFETEAESVLVEKLRPARFHTRTLPGRRVRRPGGRTCPVQPDLDPASRPETVGRGRLGPGRRWLSTRISGIKASGPTRHPGAQGLPSTRLRPGGRRRRAELLLPLWVHPRPAEGTRGTVPGSGRAFLAAVIIPRPGPGIKGTIRYPQPFLDVV